MSERKKHKSFLNQSLLTLVIIEWKEEVRHLFLRFSAKNLSMISLRRFQLNKDLWPNFVKKNPAERALTKGKDKKFRDAIECRLGDTTYHAKE